MQLTEEQRAQVQETKQAIITEVVYDDEGKPRPRARIGFQGPLEVHRAGFYIESVDPTTGKLYLLDWMHFLKTGELAWREWVTLRGGVQPDGESDLGGEESVRPGRNPQLGGLGLGTIVSLFGAPGGAGKLAIKLLGGKAAGLGIKL